MKTEAVHYEIQGIHLNQHPDPVAEEFAANLAEQDRAKHQQLVQNLATTPNMNEEYATEIDTARSYFRNKNLQTTPAVVFSPQRYLAATEPVSGQEEPATEAIHYRNLSIIGENSIPNFEDFFNKNDYVLGLLIHEGAHGTMTNNKPLTVSSNVERPADQPGTLRERIFHHIDVGGFRKYKVNEDGAITIQGDFIEEAFADLTRVRALKQLGREPKIDKQTVLADDCQVVGKGAKPSIRRKAPELHLPAEFASAARVQEDGHAATMVTPPNFAAYGLSLLNDHIPGLYEHMEEARRNPSHFKHVVKMIDSVQPGLYHELRELTYTKEDFIKGLGIIQNALPQSKRLERRLGLLARLGYSREK